MFDAADTAGVISLTKDGKTLFVNSANILHFSDEATGGARLTFSNGTTILVQEAAALILQRITTAQAKHR